MKKKNIFSIKNDTKFARLGFSRNVAFKSKAKLIFGAATILPAAASMYIDSLSVSHTSAATSAQTSFEVNVVESLSVAITTPSEWAKGNVGTFLRNAVSLNVASNNANGFTASMYSDNTTDLTNEIDENYTLPTLASSSTRGSFPANHWGYSLGTTDTLNGNTYNETSDGNNESNYYPLVNTSASPITVLTSSGSTTGSSQDIYFGAKANAAQASGSYSGTVVISVVSGVTDPETNPITPTSPAEPSTDYNSADYQATYTGANTTTGGGTNGTTVYTRKTSSGSGASATETTTTEVTEGDVTGSYVAPAGVSENTTSRISSNSMLATGLAVTSATAAASGTLFFILAKRREDDEEEEQI